MSTGFNFQLIDGGQNYDGKILLRSLFSVLGIFPQPILWGDWLFHAKLESSSEEVSSYAHENVVTEQTGDCLYP